MNIFFQSLKTKKGKPKLSKTDINIVFDGDSLTFGQSASTSQYYPKEVQSYLLGVCNSVTFNSFGIGGFSTLEMLSRLSATILPLVDNTKTNVIVAWEDVNAILNDGRTAEQNKSDFDNYFTQCKNAGFNHCILLTGYYPRLKLDGTYNQPTWNQGNPSPLDIQEDYFDLCQLGVNNCDVVVDLRNANNIGGARAQTVNTTYFADSVHLKDLGYNEVANSCINNGILQIFDL